MFRSLVDRRIIEFESGVGGGQRGGSTLRVNVELQDDFSMDQALSLYLLETIPLVDPAQPDYALVVLSLVEAILEDPEVILRRQLDRLKGQAVAQMKLDGLDYEQRMAELEKLEHPKPNRDFIYATFNAFADKHPWVGQENIRPKSIAREMFESFRSFADYVRDYELQRSEGLLLRHLNSVYKVLAQTVPEAAKDDTLREMELYLGTMLRQVDSSLLEEWEKMRDPEYGARVAAEREAGAGMELRPPGAGAAAEDVTRDVKGFTGAIRQKVFRFLRSWSIRDFEAAIEVLEGGTRGGDGEGGAEQAVAAEAGGEERWTVERLRRGLEEYGVEHERLCLDPEARNVRHTYVKVSEDRRTWGVEQVLVDPAGHNDWVAVFVVEVEASRRSGEPSLALKRLGAVGRA